MYLWPYMLMACMAGIDLIDGTPILDIKPYLPRYEAVMDAAVAQWVAEPPVQDLQVASLIAHSASIAAAQPSVVKQPGQFSRSVSLHFPEPMERQLCLVMIGSVSVHIPEPIERQLEQMVSSLEHIGSFEALRAAISEVLIAEPRSNYRSVSEQTLIKLAARPCVTDQAPINLPEKK